MSTRTSNVENGAREHDDRALFNDPSRQDEPVAQYGLLMAVYSGLLALFLWGVRRSGRRLPDRFEPYDIAAIGLATFKLSRLMSKEKITTAARAPFTEVEGPGGPRELDERPRGTGLRRVIGQLLLCPYCLGQWIGGGLVAALAVAPRPTRFIVAIFDAVALADLVGAVSRRLNSQM